jgi:hypothetical protein
MPECSANVNTHFVDGAWRLSLLAAGLYLVLLLLSKLYVILKRFLFVEAHRAKEAHLKISKRNEPAFNNSIGGFDFILILLPLTPVVQYILNNQDTLSPLGSLYVFAVFLVFSILFMVVIPTLLRLTGSTKTLMILGMAFTFTITDMASLSSEFHWVDRGSLGIQVALLSAVFLVGWILYNNQVGRKLLYVVVTVVFIANSAIQLPTGSGVKSAADGSNGLVQLVGSRRPLSTPNIYLLVYDAYVINETMLQYGIDNSAQEDHLKALGFELYPHTYTVGSCSISTMSRTLNASTEFYGDMRKGVSGDGIVQNLLKSFGYETYGMFWSAYFLQGIGSSYDFSFPTDSPETSSSHELVTKAIFMGQFAFAIEFNTISHERFVKRKISTFESVPSGPRFVYMHVFLPGHSQNSGACLPDETALFEERLVQANYEMKQDIETITQKDPSAIIVVAGDHGPYLTKNCYATGGQYGISEISRLDIQDRFGTFLAIKWPNEDFSQYDDITVVQDIFPAIFAYLFEDDTLLDARIDPTTLYPEVISGASVSSGIISGGINDGESLFVDEKR